MNTATADILESMSNGRGMCESVSIARHKRPWTALILKSISPQPGACEVCDTLKHRRYDVEIRWQDGEVERRVLCLMCEGALLYGGRL